MTADVYHADLWGLRKHKYDRLHKLDMDSTDWEPIDPQTPYYLFKPFDVEFQKAYDRGWQVTDIFPVNSVGIVTARDKLTIQWTPDEVWRTVTDFVSLSPETARDKYQLGPDAQDWQVELAQQDLRQSGLDRTKIAPIFYRPFDIRYTYYTGNSRGFICRPRPEVMTHMLSVPNKALDLCRQVISPHWCHVAPTTDLTDDCYVSNRTRERGYVLPLYTGRTAVETVASTVNEDPRRPNLAPAFVEELADGVKLDFVSDGTGDLTTTFGPEDVFHYIYAVLHSPTYRERYETFLKIDFPRIPLPSSRPLFRKLCHLGDRLTALHLMEEVGERITSYPVKGDNVVDKPRYTPPDDRAAGRVWINDEQYFEGVPPQVWAFRVGGYQVCHKWLKDRKGRALTYEDLEHYEHVVAALNETIALMPKIDEAVADHGGWPDAFDIAREPDQ